jgi:hypothetical protein
MNFRKLIVYFISLASIVLFQDCKDNAVVQPPNNNNQSPTGPVLTSPANESTTQEQSPILDWNDFNSAASYRVQVSLDANFGGTVVVDSTGVTPSQFQIPPQLLTTGIYYYWHVIANVAGGTSTWSNTWRFRIILSPPPAPNLLLPQNGAINQSYIPFFDWDDAPTAQFYKLQISTNANFSIILLDTSYIIVSQLQCPIFILNTGTQYFWRVNASNSNGVSTSPWSSIFSFTTAPGPNPNSISGQITFADTNFVLPYSQRYNIGAYDSWPPSSFPPLASDTIFIRHIGKNYISNYRLNYIPNGNYVVALFFNSSGSVIHFPIQGIYGCDTVHIPFSDCPLIPTRVQILNNIGVENINFLAWADTSKRIY